MRAAIVGCGQISAMHAAAIDDLDGVDLVAVVDRDEHRARAVAAGRPGVAVFRELSDLLDDGRVDAVHVLTPPATHAPLAVAAMESGCHVLVEKPMALSTADADKMLATAAEHGVVLSTCHNYLFKPSVARALDLVQQGAIGRPTAVSGFYGVAAERSSYAGGGPGAHWAWRLPGGVFTNFLPHLIALQQDLLGPDPDVVGLSLSATGNDPTPTELVAVLQGRIAGTMTVSLRTSPYVKYLEIFGTKGIVRADLVREVCTIHRRRRLPGAAAKVAYSAETVVQVAAGTVRSAAMVALGRWQAMPEMRVLVDDFYRSIATGTEPAVTGADGRRMVQTLERMLDHMPTRRADPGAAERAVEPRTAAEDRIVRDAVAPDRVLVTGATGFLGNHVALAFARCGSEVRALVRDPARATFELERTSTLVPGDLGDPDALRAAMDGVDVVIHCAAETTNASPWSLHHEVNVAGTEAVVRTAAAAGVRRVVHISSVIVYGVNDAHRPVTEDFPLVEPADREPLAHYLRSKIAAEEVATRTAREEGVDLVVVRPGILYGPGRPPSVGLRRLGPLLLLAGDGRNRSPLTYVGNAADAVLLAAVSADASGESFNVVDDPQPTVRDAARLVGDGERTIPLTVPRAAVLLGARWVEHRAAGDQPPRLSRFVVRSHTRDMVYASTKAERVLGWRPEVSLLEGTRRSVDD